MSGTNSDKPLAFSFLGEGWSPLTTWGQAIDASGVRAEGDVASHLQITGLSDEEVQFITTLRLTERHSPKIVAHFEEFVTILPNIMVLRTQGPSETMTTLGMRLERQWIEELLAGFIYPRVDWADDPTEYYIDYNHAPPLAILHLLALRSNFWRRKLTVHATEMSLDLREYWDTPEGTDTVREVYELAGDPFNLPPKLPDGNWDDAVFSRRQRLFFEAVPEGIRPFMEDLDLLAHITAAVHPELKEYIESYDRWCSANA